MYVILNVFFSRVNILENIYMRVQNKYSYLLSKMCRFLNILLLYFSDVKHDFFNIHLRNIHILSKYYGIV